MQSHLLLVDHSLWVTQIINHVNVLKLQFSLLCYIGYSLASTSERSVSSGRPSGGCYDDATGGYNSGYWGGVVRYSFPVSTIVLPHKTCNQTSAVAPCVGGGGLANCRPTIVRGVADVWLNEIKS